MGRITGDRVSYTLTLNAREALVVRVGLRREMERREPKRLSNAAADVYDSAASALAKLQDPANRSVG